MIGPSASAKIKALFEAPISHLINHKESFLGPRPLISAHESTSLMQFLKLLQSNSILAMPVYRNFDDTIEFYDMVSANDIMCNSPISSFFDDPDLRKVAKGLNDALEAPVSTICDITNKQIYPILHSFQPLSDLAKAFTTLGLHHCVIVHHQELSGEFFSSFESGPRYEEGHLGLKSMKILSQVDLVRMLRDANTEPYVELCQVFSIPIESIHQNTDCLVAVTPDYTALDAFKIMYLNNLSAVPIIDETGIVGMLSVSDLRGIEGNMMHKLNNNVMNVFRFLNDAKEKQGKVVLGIRKLNTKASIGEAADLMLANAIHRVWLVDDKEQLCGVLTMSDCLSLFLT